MLFIITGLGRCGTSILIKYLKEVGFGIGHSVHWHDEARAGYELSTFYAITDWLYEYIRRDEPVNVDGEFKGNYWKGLTYREALKQVDKDEKQGKVDIVKDPRITWHPDLIEAIFDARPDSRLLICHRDIGEIYYSRNHKLSERYNDPKPRKQISEYQVDFAEFFTRVMKLKIPYETFFFPDFCLDFNTTYRKLDNIGLTHNFKEGYEVWGNIIDKDLL